MTALGSILGTAVGAAIPGGPLVSILLKAGVPVLADLVTSRSPVAGQVVKSIGDALGVEPTETAIAEKHLVDPEATEELIRQVEANAPAIWAYLSEANRLMQDTFARAEKTEPWFAWAWRPVWMWLLGVFWVWRIIVVGLTGIDGVISIADLITLTLIIAGFYMGGHTVKDMVAKFTGAAK